MSDAMRLDPVSPDEMDLAQVERELAGFRPCGVAIPAYLARRLALWRRLDMTRPAVQPHDQHEPQLPHRTVAGIAEKEPAACIRRLNARTGVSAVDSLQFGGGLLK
jgi:hypothetical protein